MLARSAQVDLVVCAVVPSPWPGEPAQDGGEYRGFLDGMARAALERARERLPGHVAAASLVHHARSAPAGLLEVAERREAGMIVVGTSGHPAIGSVTARLLHGSPVPVALAPHAFRARPGARVERVTAAFAALKGSWTRPPHTRPGWERHCASPWRSARRNRSSTSSGRTRSLLNVQHSAT